MTVRHSMCLFATVLATGLMLQGQQSKTTVKHEAVAMTSPNSGKEMFMSYCASCHGKDAKGDGPAATSLKSLPADLTGLAKRNGGKYPADKVTAILRGQSNLVPHGDQEMPVWGPVFWRMSGGHEEVVQQRIANLNRYLESIQAK